MNVDCNLETIPLVGKNIGKEKDGCATFRIVLTSNK